MLIVKVPPIAGSIAAVWLVLALAACGGSSSHSVLQNPPPTITTQPVGPIITSPQSVTLTVVASGSGTLSYQWYQGPSGTTTTPISGATSSSYTTPTLNVTTSYWVQVSDSGGSVNSNTAVVLIGGPRQVQALVESMSGSGGITFNAPSTFIGNVLPNISGVSVSMSWADIETSQGVYNFTPFDAAIAPFIQSGRAVNLIVWPATEGGDNEPGSGGSTPAYVFGSVYAQQVGAANPQDMAVCNNYPGDSGSPYASLGSTIWNSSDPTYGSDLSGLPVSYEAPFMTAYQAFIAQVISHYNTPGNPKIGYIRFGFSQGGENSPECNNVWPNFSQAQYVTYYIQSMTNFVQQQNPSMTILEDLHSLGQLNMESASVYVAYPEQEAQIAVADGFGFGTNGLQKSDITNFEANQPCDSDWCNMFATYAGTSGITLSLQTLQWTDPTEAAQTGSLVQIEPFAKAHAANNLELYLADVGLAFDLPNYCSYPHSSCPTDNTSAYSNAYAAAIADFLAP